MSPSAVPRSSQHFSGIRVGVQSGTLWLPPALGPDSHPGLSPQVSGTTEKMEVDLARHLARLSEIFAARSDYLQALQFLQQRAAGVIQQLSGVPVWTEVTAQLTRLADQTAYVEYYR